MTTLLTNAILAFTVVVMAFAAYPASALAQAAPASGSNIALSEYPGPSCTKPQLPVHPQQPPLEESQSQASAQETFRLKALKDDTRLENEYYMKVQQYNRAIPLYNSALKEFDSCMDTYIQNGNADMMRIKQKLDEAAAAANDH